MFDPMWITLIVLVGIIGTLIFERVSPDVIMIAGLVTLVLCGVIDSKTAWNGFANQSVIALASLFVVGAGLRSTGALEFIGRSILGNLRPDSGLIRTTGPVAVLSAFINNTPIVAIFMPVFVSWSKNLRISPSRILLPLSFAAMMGGTCTLIGTSTNLVVHEIMLEHTADKRGLGMFELAWVGLPIVFVGMLYMVTIGRRLLPDREDLLERMETHPREYTVELMVLADCPFVGRSVRKSGLRDLPGLYLFRIERRGEVITPVTPSDRIYSGDVLHFSGIVSTVVDLQKTRGLAPVDHRSQNHAFDSLDSMEGIPEPEVPKPAYRMGRQLCEVVISDFSPLVGRSIKEANFRSHYNASVLAVHRTGIKLQQKIGQIVLEPGDTLLVDVDDDFPSRWRNATDFVLIADVKDSAPVAHERTWLAMAIFVGVVAGMSFLSSDPAVPALVGAVLMVLTGCVSSSEIPRSIELPLLLLIGAALGVGKAMQTSGADRFLAENLLSVCSNLGGDMGIVAGLFLVTSLLSQFLSNNATAALMGSLAIASASQFQLDTRPLLIIVAVAASTSFATPIGYQTNLMVRNAGGYRFMDYVRVGLPLTVLVGILAVILVPLVWPLH